MTPQFHPIEDPLPRETLRERLVASSLLAGDELDRSLKWLDAQASELGRSCALQALASEGWLTAFQAMAVIDAWGISGNSRIHVTGASLRSVSGRSSN